MRKQQIFRSMMVVVLGLVAAFPRTGFAHDDEHKRIAGQKLKMSYDAAKPTKKKFQFKTKDQIAIAGLTEVDPTTVPSSLIVRGPNERSCLSNRKRRLSTSPTVAPSPRSSDA